MQGPASGSSWLGDVRNVQYFLAAIAHHEGMATNTTVFQRGEAGSDALRPPWDAVWGQRSALSHDPDGNRADVFAPLPPVGDAR